MPLDALGRQLLLAVPDLRSPPRPGHRPRRRAQHGPVDRGPDGAAKPDPVPWPATDRAWSVPQPGPYTDMGWRIEPAGVHRPLLRLSNDYPEMPLLVTENGCAYPDGPRPGRPGPRRPADRLPAVATWPPYTPRSSTGADIRGYYLWSCSTTSSGRWATASGSALVHVDYDTQVRTPKDSAWWYRDVIRANTVS